jgi:hypothetical protein
MAFKKLIQRNRKSAGYLLLSFASIAFIVLLILPSTFFDSGQSICLSKVAFDVECYGCGMTRAIQHLIHLEFETAAHYNKLSFIVLPLLVFVILSEAYKLIKS